MPGFTLLLLGPVRLIGADNDEVRCVGPKARALLAYLATRPGRSAEREALAELLWHGPGARHALRQNLLTLRQAVGSPDRLIRAGPSTVALGPDVETDLAQFEALVATHRFEAACGLWRGSFCAELESSSERLEEWLALKRSRLEESAAGAFGELARAAEAEGRLEVAIAAARQLVTLDPFNDEAQATLIALYRRRGWTHAARVAHRRCVGLFHRELGIAPHARVQEAACTPVAALQSQERRWAARRPDFSWRRWLPAAVLLFAAASAWQGRLSEPRLAQAATAAWVGAEEWRPDAPVDTRGVPLAEAIARGLAGDPEFAHLVPGGC
jgi:DNA-binding SARP family transcriptional activator